MGTPLPPNEPAAACALCWGPGKAFGNGPPPKVIRMDLCGLQPGEDWEPGDEQLLLTPHFLEKAFGPCNWEIRDAVYNYSLEFDIGWTGCSVTRIVDNKQAFQAASLPICQTVLSSDLHDPVGVVAYDGQAVFTWNPGDLE